MRERLRKKSQVKNESEWVEKDDNEEEIKRIRSDEERRRDKRRGEDKRK